MYVHLTLIVVIPILAFIAGLLLGDQFARDAKEDAWSDGYSTALGVLDNLPQPRIIGDENEDQAA